MREDRHWVCPLFFVFKGAVVEGKKRISSLRFGLRPARGIHCPLRNECRERFKSSSLEEGVAEVEAKTIPAIHPSAG
ncbi:hypothetical protein AC624_26225 [Bacillus sp. FJAT-27238]|nr:hypothetical protein AC624_26225 [Bacillus sp. FJAT-27238]